MPVPVCPIDKIIVQFDKKYQDEIITESGIKLYKDTSYKPEWNTTVVGQVLSVPHKLSDAQLGVNSVKSDIVQEVQPGDELAFSYLVVFDMDYKKDPEYFYEVTEGETPFKTFLNYLRHQIQIRAVSKQVWIGTYTDKDGDIPPGVEGSVGTRKEVEKWLSQFKMQGDDQLVYSNLLWHNEQDYWMVDYLWAIAVKRNDEIKMIGGHVLLEPEEEDLGEFAGPAKQLILPEHLRKRTREGIAKLVSIGTPMKNRKSLDVKPGEYVRFDNKFAQKYTLWGKPYYILNQDRIIGKEKD